MNNDLKNILSNLNSDIEQEKLLEYLNKQLSEKEQHEVETHLNNDPFMNDAMEGLSTIDKKTDIAALVKQLNKDLSTKLSKKKDRRKRPISQAPWLYYAVIIILLLAVLGYIVIKKMQP
jgi:hypothetical protein